MRTCCINWEIIKARLTPSFGAKGHHYGPEPALGLPKSSPTYCSSSLPKLEPLSVIGHSLLITLLVICGLRIHCQSVNFHSAIICLANSRSATCGSFPVSLFPSSGHQLDNLSFDQLLLRRKCFPCLLDQLSTHVLMIIESLNPKTTFYDWREILHWHKMITAKWQKMV